MIAFLLALSLTAEPALVAPANDLELWRAAELGLDVPEKAYAKELTARLNSSNAYERLVALKRLRSLPGLVSEDQLKRLTELASEDVKLFDSRQCLEDRNNGKAKDCPMTTIGDHARSVLIQLPPELTGTAMIERVLTTPNAAEALSPLVARVFGDRASALVPELQKAKTTEQQAALLLLASELGCSSSAVDVASLKPFLTSISDVVKARAALVVLKRSDGCEHAAVPAASGPREHAVRILTMAIAREAPISVLDDLRRIGTAGSPLLPSLLEKLDGHDVRVVQALGVLKFRARPAAAKLASLLDNASLVSIHRDALRAISLIRPGPEQVRQAILGSVQRQGVLLPEGARALADIEAPLNASEFEYLSRLYRSQCKESSDTYSFKREADCQSTSSALTTLAARSGHRFEAR